jgi:hypothetical protein
MTLEYRRALAELAPDTATKGLARV